MAVLALALAIGANAAVFSIINALLLRPYPYHESERVVRVYGLNPQRGMFNLDVSLPEFAALRDGGTFESVSAVDAVSYNLGTDSGPLRVKGARTSANLFSMLGVRASLGRTFLPDEDHPGMGKVAVISQGLWKRMFGSDPKVLGRALRLDGNPYTVVGVLEPYGEYPDQVEIWTPLDVNPALASREDRSYIAIARLARGQSFEQTGKAVAMAGERLQHDYPETNTGFGLQVVSLLESRVGKYRPLLAVLAVVVIFVLLLACANVANLLLQRAVAREREVRLRMALGAGRMTIVRLFLIESLLLALLGGAAGLFLSQWLLQLTVHLIPFELPPYVSFGLSPAVLAFTLAVSLLAAVLYGVLPGLRWVGRQTPEALGRMGSAGLGGPRWGLRNALVSAQVALAFTLLVGAALMLLSSQHLQHTNPGFDARGVLLVEAPLPAAKYGSLQQRMNFYRSTVERLSALPGVTAATAVSTPPLSGAILNPFVVEGQQPPKGQRPVVGLYLIDGSYFPTLHLPILRGRPLTPQDDENAARVTIVSAKMARIFWPGEDPIGKKIRFELGGDTWWTVVGVTGDVRFVLNREPGFNAYLPYRQIPQGGMSLLIRTAADPRAIAPDVRRALQAIDPDLALERIETLEHIVETSVWYQRLASRLLLIFASFALGLAMVGIYGATAYSVSQRTNEIGLRMALGAETRDTMRLVLYEGLRVALWGIVFGLLGAFVLGNLLASLLFGVGAADPLTFLGVSLLLLLISTTANLFPAHRASRVDPVEALRY
jgi:putative ABC transport system permease protein